MAHRWPRLAVSPLCSGQQKLSSAQPLPRPPRRPQRAFQEPTIKVPAVFYELLSTAIRRGVDLPETVDHQGLASRCSSSGKSGGPSVVSRAIGRRYRRPHFLGGGPTCRESFGVVGRRSGGRSGTLIILLERDALGAMSRRQCGEEYGWTEPSCRRRLYDPSCVEEQSGLFVRPRRGPPCGVVTNWSDDDFVVHCWR